MKQTARLALICLGLLHGAAGAAAQPAIYSAEALQQDFQVLQNAISVTHPDPDIYVSAEKLKNTYALIAAQLKEPLTRDQALRVLAQVNPAFSDAHLLVSQPDWAEQAKEHLNNGGVLFPFDLQIAGNGEMRIRAELDGRASRLAGTRVEQVNGVPAAEIIRQLLPLVAGDSPELRAHLLSRRAWFYYWKVFGAPKRFDLVLSQPRARLLSVAGTPTLPLAVAERDARQSGAKLFSFERLGQDAALLTIKQFMSPDKPAFYAFTRDMFEKLRDERIRTLIIDIRENTGGDDDLWKTGILPYIADKPYRHASSYVKKVIPGRGSETERVGDVVNGFVSLTPPDLDNPLHFSGKTYVITGRITYSSAVLFSNVVQDFGFAKLVSAGGYANVRQSGGVQNIVLPNTGLELSVPRFVLDRPSGERQPALMRPDIVLPDSPFDPRAIVDALLLKIRLRK